MTRRVDRFRVVRGVLILAVEYTQLLECVKEWSDFEEMGGVLGEGIGLCQENCTS